MGKRNRVTTRDIAEELGISQSTVSMILSNKANVSFTEETVQKVKTKAKELGYKKPVPKELVQEKSLANTIVVLCPMVTNGYYSMMMQSITDHAKEYDYTVMTISTGRDAATEELYLAACRHNLSLSTVKNPENQCPLKAFSGYLCWG